MHTNVSIYEPYAVNSLEFQKVTSFVKSSWKSATASREYTVWLHSELSMSLISHLEINPIHRQTKSLRPGFTPHVTPTPPWSFPGTLCSSQGTPHSSHPNTLQSTDTSLKPWSDTSQAISKVALPKWHLHTLGLLGSVRCYGQVWHCPG